MSADRHILLLIDDDEVCLTFGKEILENRYTVYPVLSGEQAFTILKKIKPDIILLDIEMPGMDGYTVLNILKKNPDTKDIPVIFLTSYKDPGNELDGLNLGAVDYITKPFSPLLLVQRIENQLLLNSRVKELVSSIDILRKITDEQSAKIKKLHKVILSILPEFVEIRDSFKNINIKQVPGFLEKMIDAVQKQDHSKNKIEDLDIDSFIEDLT